MGIRSHFRCAAALLLALGLGACAAPPPPAWTVMASPPTAAPAVASRSVRPPAVPRVEAARVRPGPAPLATQRCSAVDGDTLDCAGERVRLLGLDTPERNGACAAERALADAATRRMRGLVGGGVALERRGTDRYGRTLAVARDTAGRDVAQVMVAEGLARPHAGGARAPWCPPARWR